MTRNVLTISTTNVNCERVFNIVEAVYDHRKSFNLVIFFAYMMMRFHDQKKKNSQTKLNANLMTKEKMSIEDRETKMKKRVKRIADCLQ